MRAVAVCVYSTSGISISVLLSIPISLVNLPRQRTHAKLPIVGSIVFLRIPGSPGGGVDAIVIIAGPVSLAMLGILVCVVSLYTGKGARPF